jgi:cytoskeleton protein RodZ
MPEIGATLREARMRERIDVSEIEAKTKIRAKYLRALENEEFDLLPGPTFVKSFLRTYAQALGLDDKALLEEYRRTYENPRETEPSQQPAGRVARRARPGGAARRAGAPAPSTGPSRAYIAAVGVVGVLIVLLVVGLLSGGGSGGRHVGTTGGQDASSSHTAAAAAARARRRARARARAELASLRIEPSADVYVCLIGDGGRRRIPGLTLKPGEAQPTYHARRFTLILGNNGLALVVNGKPFVVPPSGGAIDYSITRAGVRELAPSERPTTCT